MRTPSRKMPPTPVHKMKPIGYVILPLIALLGMWICYSKPIYIACLLSVFIIGWLTSLFVKRTLQETAAQRNEENICTFARSFDSSKIDTWLIRATYEETRSYLKGHVPNFPIRADDRVEEDLHIDGEDLADIAFDVALRAGYDMTDTKIRHD